MRFGTTTTANIGFGTDQNPGRDWCTHEYRAIFEFKICKANTTGPGGRISVGGEDLIRIRSKPNFAKYTCELATDHITTKCICKNDQKPKAQGKTMLLGDCDDEGWQKYSFHMESRGGMFYTCGEDGKMDGSFYLGTKPCKGCATKKYDKEFPLTSIFNNDMTDLVNDNIEGNPVLINYRGPDKNEICQEGYSWWCSDQSKFLFDFAAKKCGGKVFITQGSSFEEFVGLTPEVQECLLKELGCDGRDDVKAAIMSMVTANLADPGPVGGGWGSGGGLVNGVRVDSVGGVGVTGPAPPMFPDVDCRTGRPVRSTTHDDIDENPKCK